MHRQGRDDAIDMAKGPLITGLGFYLIGLTALFYHWSKVNLVAEVARRWPAITEHGKYLKPTHGLALLVGITVIVFVWLRSHRKAKRDAIFQRFNQSVTEHEVKNGHWVVLMFFVGGFAFAMSSAFALYPLVILILAGLIVGNVVVYRRHYRRGVVH